MNNFPKLLNNFERRSQILSQNQHFAQKQQPLQQLQQQSLAKSYSSGLARPLKQVTDRLAESCRGKIDMGSNDESDLTDLNWLSSLTPQVLANPLDVDNVGAEEMLESSMNSTSSTTEHSDASQSVSQSTETNSGFNMSHLGQRYHRFLEERKRTEGETRRLTQGNQVLLNQSSMMYESNPQPQYTKPPLSFGALICLAIESSERRRLPVRDIYLWIEGHFPYYKNAPGMSWKNSVRHNLSLSKAFVKIPRDLPGGKGCLWGINDEYRNSLISSFRRSGLSYPLVLPMGGMVQMDSRQAERPLPEYYSQAALQQQQHPMPVGTLTTMAPANFQPSANSTQFAEQFAMEQPLVLQYPSRQLSGDDHNNTFMRNLKFFNQAIKRTRSWMFKEQVEEEEEDDDMQNTVPLESHGLTPEQITELNRLSRRARRRKTHIFRHITPAPSLEHDYCKNELGQEDLYESETDDEAASSGREGDVSPGSARRARLPLSAGTSPTRRRHDRLMRKLTGHGNHRQSLWGHHGYRRSNYPTHGRIPSMQLNGNRLHHHHQAQRLSGGGGNAPTMASSAVANILTRRRRPGRPPKVRTGEAVAGADRRRQSGGGAQSRKRRASSPLVREEDEELYSDDDAETEPMIDEEDEDEMNRLVDESDPTERSVSLPIEEDDHKAAQLLLGLRRPQQVITDRNSADFGTTENGVHAQMELRAGSASNDRMTAAVPPPVSDDDLSYGDNGRAHMSPENVPPPVSPNTPNATLPKRRGRRPRKDDAAKNEQHRKEKMMKSAKSAPLTPTKAAQDFNEGPALSLNQRPKRQAAVNAPAVWKK